MLASFFRLIRTNDCSALPEFLFPPVLWPLLTSHSSLLLRIFFRIRLLDAPARPPRVLTRSFPLYLPYLPQAFPCSYWALTCIGVSPTPGAFYMVSVRQAKVLPPSFFRFRLTTDTLDLGYILPAAGWIRDFHPLERALTGHTMHKNWLRPLGRSQFFRKWIHCLDNFCPEINPGFSCLGTQIFCL